MAIYTDSIRLTHYFLVDLSSISSYGVRGYIFYYSKEKGVFHFPHIASFRDYARKYDVLPLNFLNDVVFDTFKFPMFLFKYLNRYIFKPTYYENREYYRQNLGKFLKTSKVTKQFGQFIVHTFPEQNKFLVHEFENGYIITFKPYSKASYGFWCNVSFFGSDANSYNIKAGNNVSFFFLKTKKRTNCCLQALCEPNKYFV